MDGWLNTGHQKSKISMDAVDSHKCPRCHEPNETQEHILKCHHIGAHQKCYTLVFPFLKKITMNPLCPAQEAFTKCIRPCLESPETLIPDVSSAPESQHDLIQQVIADQEQIGWHFVMRGYISKYWQLAVSVNPNLKEDNDKGEVWISKTIMFLWDFAHEMWEH
jgi:hypothetical protein